MIFVAAFLTALAFWALLWKAINKGTDTLEDILAKFERTPK